MHDSIFLASQGSNILVDLGALDQLKETLENVVHWNVSGNAALILFFKILGYTYEQIFHQLCDLKIINNTINGSSLMPENEEERIEYMKNWLYEKIDKNKLFQRDINLEDIYKQTNIFPAFILWSRNKQKIININAQNHPHIKLVDVVLASLTALGFFNEYKIKNTIFTNIFSVDCYPYLYTFLNDNNDYFYLANIIENSNKIESDLGPMQDRENELLNQFCDHNNFRINNISKTLNSEKIIKIHSIIYRGELSIEASIGLFKNGQVQAQAFLDGSDTKTESEKYLESINAQS
jgi:hypothetical protein